MDFIKIDEDLFIHKNEVASISFMYDKMWIKLKAGYVGKKGLYHAIEIDRNDEHGNLSEQATRILNSLNIEV